MADTIMIEERRRESTVRPSITGNGVFLRRLSWSAIWGGAFVAMSIQLFLSMLGVWASPSGTNLLGGQIPLIGISTGVGIWYLIYTVVAFYIAGAVSSLFAASFMTRVEQWIHGLVTWALATVLEFVWLGILTTGTAAAAPSTIAGANHLILSPGWMFGGLLLGVISAIIGAVSPSA